MKIVILQGDGMPDHPIEALGGKTPLEVAQTPNMHKIARGGTLGLVKTIPDGLPPGSDVGNLSILGYDPRIYYTGRSPLEAASIGVKLAPEDVAFRCNLVTLKPYNGTFIMKDYSAGHISSEEAKKIILDLREELEEDDIKFYPGVSYRHLMVWKGGVDKMKTTPPHDISGKEISSYLPVGEEAEKLNLLMEKSREILKNHPINLDRLKRGESPATSIWLWGQGKAPNMPTFSELYGLRGAVISAVDLVKGVGVYAGFKIVEVPGVTGYLDTNYEGKAEYALRELEEVDLVFIHLEAPDEAGHTGNLKDKIQAIEDFDGRIIAPVLRGIKNFKNYKVLLLSDHPTPIKVRTHVSEAVPFAVFNSDKTGCSDEGLVFSERCAAQTGVYIDEGWTLIKTILEK